MRAPLVDTLAAGRRPGTPGPGHGRKGHGGKRHVRRGRVGMSDAHIIRARSLARRFGERRVLERLDLDVERSAFVLVTGPNGSGKTTLLRLCAGLMAPTGGELEVAVERARIGFLGHEPLVYRELTALEN